MKIKTKNRKHAPWVPGDCAWFVPGYASQLDDGSSIWPATIVHSVPCEVIDATQDTVLIEVPDHRLTYTPWPEHRYQSDPED